MGRLGASAVRSVSVVVAAAAVGADDAARSLQVWPVSEEHGAEVVGAAGAAGAVAVAVADAAVAGTLLAGMPAGAVISSSGGAASSS
uniref:Putative secreted protein n=1 Tax=Anopheles marajoara TaxID=58244 RepID=A0A2M4CAE4_9DIPT